MKKVTFLLVLCLATVITFAADREPKAPECTKGTYPNLYDGDWHADEILPNNDVISYVTMTVPFTKVTYTGKGALYVVTHPIPGNECSETASVISDTDNENLRSMVEMVEKYPKAISRIEVGIKLKFINGITDGKWVVSSIGRPNNPEQM